MDDLLQLLGHLTPGELLLDPHSPPSPVYIGMLVVCALLFVVGIIATTQATRLSRGNRIHRRMLDLYGQWAAWLGLAGVIIVACRYSNAPLLSKRIWTVIDVVAILTVTGHLIWYRIRRYPAEMAEYREEERRRRYLPNSARRRRR